MSVAGLDARRTKFTGQPLGIEHVHGISCQVPALHQDGFGSHLMKSSRRPVHAVYVPDFESGEPFRLVQVRRHERGVGYERVPDCIERIVGTERPAVLAHNHGVHHQGESEVRGRLRHGSHDRSVTQRSRLGRGGRNIVEHRAELMQHQHRWQAFDVFQGNGVLDRDERNHGFAVNAQLMKGLEIGLNACAARWIGTGDRQSYRLHRSGNPSLRLSHCDRDSGLTGGGSDP